MARLPGGIVGSAGIIGAVATGAAIFLEQLPKAVQLIWTWGAQIAQIEGTSAQEQAKGSAAHLPYSNIVAANQIEGPDGKPRFMNEDEIAAALQTGFRPDGQRFTDADGKTPLDGVPRETFIKQFTDAQQAEVARQKARYAPSREFAETAGAFSQTIGTAVSTIGTVLGGAVSVAFYALVGWGAEKLFDYLRDTDFGRDHPWVGKTADFLDKIGDKVSGLWDKASGFWNKAELTPEQQPALRGQPPKKLTMNGKSADPATPAAALEQPNGNMAVEPILFVPTASPGGNAGVAALRAMYGIPENAPAPAGARNLLEEIETTPSYRGSLRSTTAQAALGAGIGMQGGGVAGPDRSGKQADNSNRFLQLTADM